MSIRTLTISALLVAIAVAGSTFVSIPTGVARAYPVQHAINVVSAILLGPIPSILIAFTTAIIRILTGTGSLLAIPGSVIGACCASLFYQLRPSVIVSGFFRACSKSSSSKSVTSAGAFILPKQDKYGRKMWLASIGEIVGTGIIASLVAVPYAQLFMGTTVAAFFFMPAFLTSSVIGAFLGIIIASSIQKSVTLQY
ncbi:energy coupling factor transporter S component ThiW [Lysinibacillus piscis]|uniref:ThiW protein n=1 Tax=Lysinibacillus piscis TaxID=2518931 RepID=A0ABQ5NH80_9BACI|nr:energy coupling factor transporter S component ThiW [Lysinibacillus sp. KH24]GLC87650.1 thiW protein [Lysinibacillus sp. KH24]